MMTAMLFIAGQSLIALYLGRTAFTSIYGAFGSLFMLLIWVYYSCQVFFVGAEFTKIYARRYGSHAAQAAPIRRVA
jgi:membrane protein